MTLDCNTTISWYQIYFNAPATGQSITTPTGLLVCVFFFSPGILYSSFHWSLNWTSRNYGSINPKASCTISALQLEINSSTFLQFVLFIFLWPPTPCWFKPESGRARRSTRLRFFLANLRCKMYHHENQM